MLTAFPLTTLALIAALLVYFGLGVVVGQARARYDVPAPRASGHPEFDKRNRVHINTLEQLALLVPAVVVGAPVLGDMVTAGLTAVWSLGRILYARAYYADPAKRGPGFGLTFFPSLILLVAGAWGAITGL
ncbi:MAPEG family protein [Sandarakinorhabdus rubra]|uniref:MAPEG family protein n=1 Tax=Sandarakinorhabdus rubra TaxID=2672568 RepID=UPI001969A696|nr:MAPEG family protein [Sandarakinorhabdus rubra]